MTTYTAANPAASLEQRMSLLAWLQWRLGYDSTREMLEELERIDEGFDGEGRSHIYAHLAARASRLNDLTTNDLERYDGNIRDHLAAMNAGRQRPITLRYFQYMAALCAEIYLDDVFNAREKMLASINAFVDSRNSNRHASERLDRFVDSDLNKLAFWMATGSGKTLLMHINYRQYMRYCNSKPDSVLLITPNEGLTQQHLVELADSGIPASRFDLDQGGLLSNAPGEVKATEITKLVLEKRGEGESVPVEAFDGDNLVFVDEGHKGSGGEAWRAVRDALGETGFTFEYSATFGQALTAASRDALTAEYGKAIAFDYSYRYFYGDGYGKDFHILNLHEDKTGEQTDKLLLANMLSFYEQQLVFERKAGELGAYNLDRPLWVFVGSSVNAVRTERGLPQSDVLNVVSFLRKFLTDPLWAREYIGELQSGQSGLRDQSDETDTFADKLPFLRQLDQPQEAIYQGVLEKVLHASASGALHVTDIRGHEGELGLKVGGAQDFFGLIYVGDTSRFKRLVERSEPEIVVEDDSFSGSLFQGINEPDTTVQMLIGSRKFMEGWNSWRVSNMGLLNIGKSEGSQIIQLFGRGVRLRGRDMSLKRSAELSGNHPEYIRLLETLNIFAVRANYMAQFRDYLEREGVPTENMQDLHFPIRPNAEFLKKGLVVPRPKDDLDFNAESWVVLEPDNAVKVAVDVSARVTTIASGQAGEREASSGDERSIPSASLDLVDWAEVYRALLEHKQSKGMDNLIVSRDVPRRIIENDPRVYTLRAERSVVKPKSTDDLDRLQAAVLGIVRRYADALYRRRRARWEAGNLVYKELDEHDSNFQLSFALDGHRGGYVVSVPRSDGKLIEEIERLIGDCAALYRHDGGDPLPRIHFDRHLYQPLLVADKGDGLKFSPPGLNPGERRFVDDLRAYWSERQAETPDEELFLLRNQGRGAGIGFFDNYGFYPDFILWQMTGNRQRIIFIEPHGMLQAPSYANDEKAQLHERLPALAKEISQRSEDPNVKVRLDSYIVSQTSFDDLRMRYDPGDWSREDFARRHILFPVRNENYDYVEHILREDDPE